MQTPLQRLIEIIGWRKTAGEELGLPDSDPGMIQINLTIRDATELLEKERKVIEDSYFEGMINAPDSNYIKKTQSPQDYFTKTFTDESK